MDSALADVNRKVPEFIDVATKKLEEGLGRAVQGNLSTALKQLEGKADRQREALGLEAIGVLDHAATQLKRSLVWVACAIALTNVGAILVAVLVAKAQ